MKHLLTAIVCICGMQTIQAQTTEFVVRQQYDTVRVTQGFLKSDDFTYFNTQKLSKDNLTKHPVVAVKLPGKDDLYKVLKFTVTTASIDTANNNVYIEQADHISGNTIYKHILNRINNDPQITALTFSKIHFAYGDSIGILNYIGVTFTKE